MKKKKNRPFLTLTRDPAQTVPATFVRDCLKEIYQDFSSESNATNVMASPYFRIRFWVNDVHYVSANWRELFLVLPRLRAGADIGGK